MKKSNTELVYEQMLEILAQHPDGLRAKDLQSKIAKNIPNVKENTIWGSLKPAADKNPEVFARNRERGVGVFYSLVRSDNAPVESTSQTASKPTHRKEKDKERDEEKKLYAPCAEYLQYTDEKDNADKKDNDYLEECSVAIPWGDTGGKLGKWGTPDVIGIFKPEVGALVPFLRSGCGRENRSLTCIM